MVLKRHPRTPATRRTGWRVLLLSGVLIFLLLGSDASAHEVPNAVTVQAFVKPEGERLLLLVRVPLEALEEVDWPTFGPGYLDFAALDAVLRELLTLTRKLPGRLSARVGLRAMYSWPWMRPSGSQRCNRLGSAAKAARFTPSKSMLLMKCTGSPWCRSLIPGFGPPAPRELADSRRCRDSAHESPESAS